MQSLPQYYETLLQRSNAIGFTMPSDRSAGELLKVLCASKPGGKLLELGTGMGLSLAWMLAGTDENATLLSLDNDEKLIDEVTAIMKDDRLDIIATDGDQWIIDNQHQRFDLIFADTWPGKYRLLNETIDMLAPGGLYLIDDMNPQENWPEGHAEKAQQLRSILMGDERLITTELAYGTGMYVSTRKTSAL